MSVATYYYYYYFSDRTERESGHMASNHTDTQNTQSDKDEPSADKTVLRIAVINLGLGSAVTVQMLSASQWSNQ